MALAKDPTSHCLCKEHTLRKRSPRLKLVLIAQGTYRTKMRDPQSSPHAPRTGKGKRMQTQKLRRTSKPTIIQEQSRTATEHGWVQEREEAVLCRAGLATISKSTVQFELICSCGSKPPAIKAPHGRRVALHQFPNSLFQSPLRPLLAAPGSWVSSALAMQLVGRRNPQGSEGQA